MAVTDFGLKNFMAFGPTGFGLDGFVEFRKINLLYGRNSHGKSVMIRALRLLKQSLSINDEGPFRFADAGGVDLGSFEAVLHKSTQEKELRFHPHNDEKNNQERDEENSQEQKENVGSQPGSSWKRPISFRFRCEITKQQLTDAGKQKWEAIPEIAFAPRGEDVLCFEVSLSYSTGVEKETKKKGVFLVGFDLWLAVRFGNKAGKRLLTLQRDPDLDQEWSAYSDANLPLKNSVALASFFTRDCTNGFLPTLSLAELRQEISNEAREQLNEISHVWGVCRKEIGSFLHSILYIGPIRPLPVRYYLIDQREKLSTYWEGALAYRDYLLNPSGSKYLQERLDHWLSKFELGHSVRLNKDNEANTKDGLLAIRELLISEEKSPHENQAAISDRNLKDMGFGASQILPVIVSCLVAPEDAFIIIEQPELHLHPEAQADTADLFIETVNELTTEERNKDVRDEKRREEKVEGVDRDRVKRRCLIETHSEHMLLRFQLRMAGGAPRRFNSNGTESKEKDDLQIELAGRDFGLIFVTRNRQLSASNIEHIDADPFGKLHGGTFKFDSFFERDFLDSLAFSIASGSKVTKNTTRR